MQVETVGGLDCFKVFIHHFKGPMRTKAGQELFLTIKPPKIIPNSGHYLSIHQKDYVKEQS